MVELINQRVSRCRKLAGLTHSQTAEKMGMKCSTYSQMERRGNISAQRLAQLAEIFGVDTGVLLYGETPLKSLIAEERELTKPQSVVKLNQPTELSYSAEPLPLKLNKKEEGYIKILRNLPKNERDEIIALLEEKHKKNRTKSAD